MKIANAGTGYVGLSNAMIFAQRHQVVAYDLQAEKIKLLKIEYIILDNVTILGKAIGLYRKF